MHLRHLPVSLAMIFVLTSLSVRGGEIEWVPKGRRFPLTFGDPKEIRMAILLDGSSRIRANVGNYFSILGVNLAEDGSNKEQLQLGFEGAGFFSLREGQSGTFPLETLDGLFGFYAEMDKGDWQFQGRLTHISAHLADGLPGTPIKYSRESLIARVGYSPSKGMHFYSGINLMINARPVLPPWGAQLGGHYFLPWSFGRLTPFTALDIQWRDEAQISKWGVNLHLGIALNDPLEPYHSFRVFYNYFSGADPRGQFLNRPFTAHSLGVEMQI